MNNFSIACPKTDKPIVFIWIRIPLEAKYWHLLINHFNNDLQEVKGKVDGFAEISREKMIN
jgi:hypothetical protein